MKKRLLNISLITLLALSMVILGPMATFAAISPNSPAGGVYIVPDQKIYNALAYCTYNDTTFTLEVLMEDFTGVAGYQFKIDYNSTLLALDSWTFDTDPANPMSPTQMAPDSGDRVDTDVSSPGTVQLATVWKSGVATYTYAGNATAAELVFRIIYCPEQIVSDPPVPNTVSTALTFDTGNTRCVDTNGDDILFTNFGDGYYEYTTQGLGPTAPTPNFVWDPPFPSPSDTVVLTDLSDANGEGDFLTAWDWDISGPATLLPPYGPTTTTFDYYVVAGYQMDPTPPAPAPDPAGFDVTFYSMNGSNPGVTLAPVYNFGNVDTWGGRTYLYNGVEGAPSIMGARVDIQNLLGFDITILNLTVAVTASTPATDPLGGHNSSQIMVDTLDPYAADDGDYDECDYTPGNETVLVKRMPDMYPSGNVLDRFGLKHRDPTGYPEGPGPLLNEDKNASSDALAYGHVAPIDLANGATYYDFFGPVLRSERVDYLGNGTQLDATLTFYLTWVAQDGPSLEFHCDGEGDVEVTLTVWDNEGQFASITKFVPQRIPPAAEVDLWTNEIRFCGQITDKLGKGFAVPADALSPDVNVTFLALVTWGGAPLAHRLVGFEIVDPQSNNIVTRTAETNKSGVAVIWWRVPLMNPPEQIFGVWNATVSVKIQDTKVYDYMPFKVGYVVTITGKWEDKTEYDIGNPDGSATDGDYIEVTVELKNIMMIEKEVYIAVTIYDDCDVPILKLQDSLIIGPEFPWCSSYFMNVTLVGRIPHWAYVGVGKVYANVYTAPPFACGTPYSPEVANLISLVWSGELLCHD